MRHSELACFVLGLVWQHGPCTPYQVRRTLLDSPSSGWSGSAGAIYPLVARLEREGLVAGRPSDGDRRNGRRYVITAKGKALLKRWIGPPLPSEAVTVTADPLRSRARFLGLLSVKERAAWVDEAERALDAVLQAVRRWDERYGQINDPHLRSLTRHAELETDSRRRWLRDLRRATGGKSGPRRRPPA